MDTNDKPEHDVDELRRFDGRRLIKEAYNIFLNDYYRQFVPDIEKILAVSKERKHYKDPQRHFGLQLGLLRLLQAVEKASSEGNREARKTGDKKLALQSKRNKYIAKAYKEIADGIAWRTLGYSRFRMRVLSQGVYTGHTWGKDVGQTAELKRAATAARNGAFVLMNDITNCLRIGDLTTLPPRDDGRIHVAEIKRKELILASTIAKKIQDKQALDTQEARLIQAQFALDMNIMPMGGKKIPVVPIAPITHDVLPGAAAVMKKAMAAGAASKMLTPYMLFEAMHMPVLADLNDAKALQNMLDKIVRPEGLTPIMKHTNYDRLILSAGGQLMRSTPPYTIYPWPLKTIAKLITGELFVTTTIYFEPLVDAFRALGWELTMNEQAIEDFQPTDDDNLTKDFTGRVLMPYDGSNAYNEAFWLRNPATGFNVPAGDRILQMGTEFTTARYVASVAQTAETIATPERPNPSVKWPDIQDGKRWN